MQKLVEFLESQRARYRGLEDAGDKLTSLKARGLLLDTVHHLQVARTLLKTVVSGENAGWMWYKQLRSYKTVSFDCNVDYSNVSRSLIIHIQSMIYFSIIYSVVHR